MIKGREILCVGKECWKRGEWQKIAYCLERGGMLLSLGKQRLDGCIGRLE